jgi:hypothetical protein
MNVPVSGTKKNLLLQSAENHHSLIFCKISAMEMDRASTRIITTEIINLYKIYKSREY